MIRLLCSICVLASLTLSFAVASEPEVREHRTLRAAYVDFPPLTYTDENGNPAGYFIELSEQIAENAGYRLQWSELPVGRIYMFLKSGRIDFWAGLGGLPHIQSWVVESRPPIGNLTLAAFHFDHIPPVSNFDELAGSRLILLSGYTYLGAIDHLISDEITRVYTAPHHNSAMRMLTLGRGDYVLAYVEPMTEVLQREPVKGLRWSELMTSRLAFVVSRKTEGYRQIMDRLEAELGDGLASYQTPGMLRLSPFF